MRDLRRLFVQKEGKQCFVHPQGTVVINESHLAKAVHEKRARDRVVPTISARVPWLTFRLAEYGLDRTPKPASNRRVRASRLSLELSS